MALAQAQLLTVGNLAAYQSYWVNSSVVISEGASEDLYEFLTFDSGVIVTTNTGDNQTLSITLPATSEMFGLVEQCIRDRVVWKVSIIEFEAMEHQTPGTPIPNSLYKGRQTYERGEIGDNLQLLSRFYGEVINADSDTVDLNVQLGSSLSPVGSQVPPRKFSTLRVGAPLRL